MSQWCGEPGRNIEKKECRRQLTYLTFGKEIIIDSKVSAGKGHVDCTLVTNLGKWEFMRSIVLRGYNCAGYVIPQEGNIIACIWNDISSSFTANPGNRIKHGDVVMIHPWFIVMMGRIKKREAHAPSVGKYGENNALEQPPQDRKHIEILWKNICAVWSSYNPPTPRHLARGGGDWEGQNKWH